MVDYLLTALMELFQWASDKAQQLFGIDVTNWHVNDKLSYAYNSFTFCNDYFPILSCMNILLVGFAAKLAVMAVRYIVGWFPGVDG